MPELSRQFTVKPHKTTHHCFLERVRCRTHRENPHAPVDHRKHADADSHGDRDACDLQRQGLRTGAPRDDVECPHSDHRQNRGGDQENGQAAAHSAAISPQKGDLARCSDQGARWHFDYDSVGFKSQGYIVLHVTVGLIIAPSFGQKRPWSSCSFLYSELHRPHR